MSDLPPKLLFVDDDPAMLAAVSQVFRDRHSFDTADNGADALRLLRTDGPYALMVADESMPGMAGIELLEQARQIAPDMVGIMLTGNSDQRTAIEAVNRGRVFYFLHKPCPPEALTAAVESGVNHYRLAGIKRQLAEGSEAASVRLLVKVLGMVAPEALGRGQRLRDSMQVFSDHLGIGPEEKLPTAALLSQLGYASVPLPVMRKLTGGVLLQPQEKAVVQRLPQFGHDLISGIPSLAALAPVVLYQQKHFDGTGYPAGEVVGESIPVGARMLKILLDRVELEGEGIVKQAARQTMGARAGFYDPALLDQSFAALPDFLPNSLSKDRPVTKCSAVNLIPGQVVVSHVVSRSGHCLLEAGICLTDMTIKRIRHYADLNEITEPILVQSQPAGSARD